VSAEHSGDKGSATDVDPTLGAGETFGIFPDTCVGTHLVLYQTADGAVDLRWRIDPADVAHARGAFGGADAHPVLRLRRLGGHGDEQLMADADLGGDSAAEDGLAHYAGTDAEGLLRAEIGLAGADGGWMLIARSNVLPAAAAVGAAFLRDDAASAPSAQPTPEPAPVETPVASVGDDRRTTATQGAAVPEALRLEPTFPVVEAPLSPAALAEPRTPPAGTGSQAEPRHSPDTAQTTPGTGASSSALATEGPASARAEAAELPLEPPPGGVVPRLAPRQTPHAGAAAPAEQGAAPVAGSGPLRRPNGAAELSAELVLHGSAPPHTLLDLGGHSYRVGPGGRFVLHIPIREHALILRLLATLPHLPVSPRPEERDAQG
jgi:hypothetical protein